MKLWWVFAYDQYYPAGALGDMRGAFATEEEARDYAESIKKDYDYVDVENIMRIATEEFAQ